MSQCFSGIPVYKEQMMRAIRAIACLLVFLMLSLSCAAQEKERQLVRLKAQYAREAGWDALPEIRQRADSFRREMLAAHLLGETAANHLPRLKSLLGQQPEEELVLLRQIYVRLPQNITRASLASMEQQMDSIYRALQQGASFAELMERFSEVRGEQLIGRFQMPAEFEEKAYSLPVNEISAPFQSPLGIHIIQVLEHKSANGRDVLLAEQLKVSEQKNIALEMLTEQLKRDYAFSREDENCKDLIRRGQTDRVLFTIAGRQYTGDDFARFYAAHYGGVAVQLEKFIAKCLLDHHTAQSETLISIQADDYLDDLLATEATRREVTIPSEDEAALKAYFETHKNDFRWETDRYDGIVVQAAAKKILKRARKLLKKSAPADWESLLAQTFNEGGEIKVMTERGVFAPGDNAVVDDLVFRIADDTPPVSFPYVDVHGKKVKGPDRYAEVPREEVVEKLRKYLTEEWEKRLLQQR